MIHIEKALDSLKELVDEMLDLTASQMKGSREAYLNWDAEIAEEVIGRENRLNAMELAIDKECENTLALFNPVASDLRYVIMILKVISDLERIGDYAYGISKYVIEGDMAPRADLVASTGVVEMFDTIALMLEDIHTAFEEENSKLARKVYKKDSKLNAINEEASTIIGDFILKDTESVTSSLYLFSVIRKLERAGDHIKNIAEDLIFFVDVEILKHKKKSKKIDE